MKEIYCYQRCLKFDRHTPAVPQYLSDRIYSMSASSMSCNDVKCMCNIS